jgi:hypothetical protein
MEHRNLKLVQKSESNQKKAFASVLSITSRKKISEKRRKIIMFTCIGREKIRKSFVLYMAIVYFYILDFYGMYEHKAR